MASKEKKGVAGRLPNSSEVETPTTDVVPSSKKRGRKPKSELTEQPVKVPVKRSPRVKREGTPARGGTPASETPVIEDLPKSTPRSRKPFLEKELEDILENATGRNTPLDERGSFFVPKSRPDDDTLSMRSLSTFLRARRGGERELEDDVLSLRSLRVRNEDDLESLRSLPAKRGRRKKAASPVAEVTPVPAPKPKGRPRKNPEAKPVKKKAAKTKEPLKSTKKPLRLQNKIGASKRSNLLLTKKVRNAKLAVERIHKKKAIMRVNQAVPKIAAVAAADEETSLKENETVPIKREVPEDVTPAEAVSSSSGPPAPPGKRRRLVRGPLVPVGEPTPGVLGTIPAVGKRGRKRKWVGVEFEEARSPNDSSLIIVQPRLAKVPRISPAAAAAGNDKADATAQKAADAEKVKTSLASPTETPVPMASPTEKAGVASASSTPYFIHTVANLNALKSHPTARGDWLVTPTGVVLIQPVPQNDRTSSAQVQGVDGTSGSGGKTSVNGIVTALTPSPAVVAAATGSAVTPLTISGSGMAPSSSLEPALGASASPPLECSPSVTGSATDPSPADSAAVDEKPKEMLTAGVSKRQLKPNPRAISRLSQSKEVKAGERRASHDGSFGTEPRRKVQRSGSSERFGLAGAVNILELGSAPLPLTQILKATETDSSFSLKMPLTIPKQAPPPKEDGEISSEEVENEAADQALPVVCNGRTTPITLEVDTKMQEATSQSLTAVKEEVEEEGVSKVRPADRKQYSKSVDSQESLLASPRRRSYPEPKVINIVTLEDGSRRGPTLADELRHKLRLKFDLPDCPPSPPPEEDTPPTSPPMPSAPPSTSAAAAITVEESNTQVPAAVSAPLEDAEEHSEDLKLKESLFRALGLQSLKAAEEYMKTWQAKRDARRQVALVAPVGPAPSGTASSGTLKTVIKRLEKKGNGRMTYKASSSLGVNSSHEMDEQPRDPSPISHESDEDGKNGNGKAMTLVIPEKASSFSIHPQRVCSDVCTYCFGKFGLLDTPCHIAQLKDSEKRRSILKTETHLTLDSCLCDACFRHVDKKANGPSGPEKRPGKRKLMVEKTVKCAVENCDLEGTHSVKRKILQKLKRSLMKKLVFDQAKLDKVLPSHIAPVCNRHIYWIDYFMDCGICKKRLSTVHMYRAGPYTNELNCYLSEDGIPAVLTDKRFLCKLCQCYSSIRLKVKSISEMNSSQRQFHEKCRKRILRSHGIDVPDSEAEADADASERNKKGKKPKVTATVTNENGDEAVDAIEVMEVENNPASTKATNNSEDMSDIRARFTTTPPATPGGFYKCNTTLQFTAETRRTFYDLQRPYGNHSSFFRHMVMLEKLFRNGDLVLSRRAQPSAAKYINNVQNRLKSFDGVSMSTRPFTITAVPASTSASTSTSAAPAVASTSRASITPSHPPPSTTTPASAGPPPLSPLTQLQSTVHNIGMKPDISISSVGSEPRKLTPKIQENLRALANRGSKPSGPAKAVILNRTVGGMKQSLVQVTTNGKTIHLTLAQFQRIQQMQIRKKQALEQARLQAQQKAAKIAKANGDATADVSNAFPNIPKALSVSVTKVDLTRSPNNSD